MKTEQNIIAPGLNPYNQPGTIPATAVTPPYTYGGGGVDVILWRFNEQNTAQISSAPTIRTTALAELNLTAATTSFLGPYDAGGVGARLRFDFTMVSANSGSFIYNLFYDDGSPVYVPERFVWRMRIAHAINMKVGVFLWNDNTADPWGYGMANGPTLTTFTEPVRAEGPTPAGNKDPFVMPATTVGGADPRTAAGQPSVGATVTYTFSNFLGNATSALLPRPMAHMSWTAINKTSSQEVLGPAGPTYPSPFLGNPPIAGWTGREGTNRLAILFVTSAPTGTSASVELAEMALYTHPMGI